MMLSKINIKNLRSIKDETINIAPLTIFYGPNGSGKSTIMHSIAIFKNIVLNPNRPVNDFFRFYFADFGGFENVVFNHILEKKISIKIETNYNKSNISYEVSFNNEGDGKFDINFSKGTMSIGFGLEISFPYEINKFNTIEIEYEGKSYEIHFDGLKSKIKNVNGDINVEKELVDSLNFPTELLKNSDFISLIRGFSKYSYEAVPTDDNINKNFIITYHPN